MQSSRISFGILFFVMMFLVSCCHKKINTGYDGDHPLNPKHTYFVLQTVLLQGPEDVQMPLASMVGSGVAFRGTNKFTDILTAGHVCAVPEAAIEIGATQDVTVFDITGHQYSAKVYAIDPVNDLCALRIKERRPTIKLASRNPDIGDKVYAAGYPSSFYNPGTLHFVDGYFGGVDTMRTGSYTLPSAPGSSGSAITNDKGELIGIVSAVLSEFNNVTIGPSVEPIAMFLILTEDCDAYCI